jgi:hypothetical protein
MIYPSLNGLSLLVTFGTNAPCAYDGCADNTIPSSGCAGLSLGSPTSADQGYNFHYTDGDEGDQTSVIQAIVDGDSIVITLADTTPVASFLARSISDQTTYALVLGQDAVIPEVPTDVAASNGTETSKVAVSWSAATGAASYKVYRNTSDSTSGATEIAAGVLALSYDDAAAPQATPLWYFVKATNENGDSDFSASAAGWRAVNMSLYVLAADYTANALAVLLSGISAATIVTGTTITAVAGGAHVDGTAEAGGTTFNPFQSYYYWAII